jgi:hypothetical protein
MRRNNANKMVKMNEARHMVITPKFRVSFPNVFTARSFQDDPDQKKCFQLDMIFDSTEDFKKAYKGKKKQTVSMLQAINNAKADQWGSDPKKWPKFPHKVFKDGNERTNKDGEIYAGYEGKHFVTAKSSEKFPPKVVGMDGKPLDESEFYGGCYAIAQLMARPYDFGGNKGVRYLLLSIQKVEDGEKFGGVSEAEDVFDVSEVNEDNFEGGETSEEEYEEEF